MTIYILDDDPVKTAQALDDKSLDRMIKDIAQVLCNVHHIQSDYINDPDYFDDDIPLSYSLHAIKKMPLTEWSQWSSKCVANYKYLVELAYECGKEVYYRFEGKQKIHDKYYPILEWARDNVPDLPDQVYRKEFGVTIMECGLFGNEHTQLPIVMPKKYLIMRLNSNQIYGYDPQPVLIESYQNYYKSKLKQKQCMEHDGCIYAQQNNCLRTKPNWTRRDKPEWLEL